MSSNDYMGQLTAAATNAFNYMRVPVLASSGLAAVMSGLLYFKQNELIYPRNFPAGSRTDVFRPRKFGFSDYEELHLPTPDGETIGAFLLRPSNESQARKVTVIMFHGNAGNIGHRVPIGIKLQEDTGCKILMLEYRGYGFSTGTPDERGLLLDAQTGLDYIRQRADLRDDKVIVYGQSLGGSVGIQLVAKNRDKNAVIGLILENTFLSMRKIIPRYIDELSLRLPADLLT
ncbi:MAG: Alpha/beta hydrolase domain-containing protein 13 [Thelocarpon superellum]|nr:MAG: Alpha/beta hydrolase domain-containing protein 13 [Thelocarpon superellum]